MNFSRLAIVFFIVPSLGISAEWFKGENLLTETIPFEEQYEAYVKEEQGWISRLWKSKESGDDDTYVVNIVDGGTTNLK